MMIDTASPKPLQPAAPGKPAAAPWPSAEWSTWSPTSDRGLERNPVDFMQANPIAPHADAVAQADFAYGGNYMAHGSLDVFAGATYGRYDDARSAYAAAQALQGAEGIVGVFRESRGFDVRELLVSPSSRRGAGDDVRDPRPEARPRPDRLIQLRDVGEPNGDWGHGDFRTLSALRFVSDDLVGFVRGDDQVTRTGSTFTTPG